MKEFWVDVHPWRKELATAAIESGADVIVTETAAKVKALGRMTVLSDDGDLRWGIDVGEVVITGTEGMEEAEAMARKGFVVVETSNWRIIPLENLVASSDRIIAVVRSEEEAELALTVLEKGVRGILLKDPTPALIRKIGTRIRAGVGKTDLVPFTITDVRPVGMGDRVCVDTCSMMKEGEGILVGNTSSAFLLVQAETLENPYVSPRPFRVNAGAVHAYTLVPGEKTAYLSDLSAGDHVLLVDHAGMLRDAGVGRVKIEQRPLLLVEAEADGVKASLVLQNAETVRLVGEDGIPISVVALAPGDRVLGRTLQAGRHFGIAVKESIIEK
ncbi:MAG TPA: 3-dehydroquinate synthase II [Methanoregulaceae archaeon]|nr:MAG: 3-dehydroquinate synthase II [Methanolinea sp.]HON80846.1 3-dehydroquinate synthase II [Methanoregulaceae archaeon]HPD09581.1 3-dehydroquinate synthase II [Methanoregulaceae archaeon]HRT15252.1 3-dehydroquinate synthase II [Methanoregulaceae archaeon]HRU30823.1 3-dehydroquinate synthase II [Methanoregulaceae archaeon]